MFHCIHIFSLSLSLLLNSTAFMFQETFVCIPSDFSPCWVWFDLHKSFWSPRDHSPWKSRRQNIACSTFYTNTNRKMFTFSCKQYKLNRIKLKEQHLICNQESSFKFRYELNICTFEMVLQLFRMSQSKTTQHFVRMLTIVMEKKIQLIIMC